MEESKHLTLKLIINYLKLYCFIFPVHQQSKNEILTTRIGDIELLDVGVTATAQVSHVTTHWYRAAHLALTWAPHLVHNTLVTDITVLSWTCVPLS